MSIKKCEVLKELIQLRDSLESGDSAKRIVRKGINYIEDMERSLKEINKISKFVWRNNNEN